MASVAAVAPNSPFSPSGRKRNRSEAPVPCHLCHGDHEPSNNPTADGAPADSVGECDRRRVHIPSQAVSVDSLTAVPSTAGQGTVSAPKIRIEAVNGERLLTALVRVAFAVAKREREGKPQ